VGLRAFGVLSPRHTPATKISDKKGKPARFDQRFPLQLIPEKTAGWIFHPDRQVQLQRQRLPEMLPSGQRNFQQQFSASWSLAHQAALQAIRKEKTCFGGKV